ncbi:HAMP domain-containing sensor histidine kinase [Hutsoniella sourekii]|uniref:HAMP domain-containing sensor histidine kinase n=1 Tax=Hutsoniella sourekii TaxID=87650 RepID=UPI0004B73510|nr:HAMP domain-containing sensor histidine kinase [Hutsoniella sourekii]
MFKFIRSRLWLYFTFLTFILMAVFLLLLLLVIYLLSRLSLVNNYHDLANTPTIIVAVFCVFMGVVIASLLSNYILRPITKLKEAMLQVTQQNFDIQLEEKQFIREVQELYSSFNTMVQDLRNTEIIQNDFISTVSHEFKTPLASIQGNLQLLDRPNLDSLEIQQAKESIYQSVRRLSKLSQNILQLTKLEQQNKLTPIQTLSLDEELRQALLGLQSQWESKQLTLDLQLDPVTIEGHADLLQIVWFNLLDNAIKYNQAGGSITITCQQDQAKAFIEIANTGPAIPEEQAVYIFNKFYQVNSSRIDEGNGLGLSLCQKIIHLHQGNIQLVKHTGPQTKFCIQLPLEQKQEPSL